MSQSMLRQAAFVVFTVALAAGPFSTSEILAQAARPSGSGQSVAQGPTISISMEDAVRMAIESNLGLSGDRLAPEIQAQTLAAARAFYNPIFTTSASRGTTVSVPTSFLDTNATSVESSTNSFNTSIGQNLRWYGGNYVVSFGGSRSENTQAGNTFNPTLGSTLNVQFSQPLLRNFRIDPARAAVKTNQIQQQITDVVLLESIARTSRDARLQYLNLVGAIEGRKVAQQNLDLAKESLRNDRARVDVGLMAPVDIVGSEASVADREDSLIIAEGNVARATDQLRQFIFDPSRPDYWTATIVPTDTINAQARELDVDAAIKTALENRSDLVQQRKNLEINRVTLDVLKNATLPNLDFRVNYRGSGTAGTQFRFPNQDYTSPELVGTKGFSSAIGDAFGYVQPAWTYSLQGSYPILGRSDTKANYARTQLQMRQAEIQLRESEMSVALQARADGAGVACRAGKAPRGRAEAIRSRHLGHVPPVPGAARRRARARQRAAGDAGVFAGADQLRSGPAHSLTRVRSRAADSITRYIERRARHGARHYPQRGGPYRGLPDVRGVGRRAARH
jgi:outer membrane protein